MIRFFRKFFAGEQEYKVVAAIEWEGGQRTQKVFTNFAEVGEVMEWFADQGGQDGGYVRLEFSS